MNIQNTCYKSLDMIVWFKDIEEE